MIPFDFEGDAIRVTISTPEDLKKLFKLYEATYSKKQILAAKCKYLEGLGNDPQSYGFKHDHKGKKTLEEFLIEQNVTI